MLSWFTPTLLARLSARGFAAPPVAQAAAPEPVSFFWAGILTALVPMLVLGVLGGVAVRLYLRERGRTAEERAKEASDPA